MADGRRRLPARGAKTWTPGGFPGYRGSIYSLFIRVHQFLIRSAGEFIPGVRRKREGLAARDAIVEDSRGEIKSVGGVRAE